VLQQAVHEEGTQFGKCVPGAPPVGADADGVCSWNSTFAVHLIVDSGDGQRCHPVGTALHRLLLPVNVTIKW
jgi:hypothetical protein